MESPVNKTCKRCGAEKPHADFYASDNTCKPCRCAMVRANRLSKVEYYRAYDVERTKRKERIAHLAVNCKKFRAENPEKYKAHRMVNNAIRDGKIVKKPCEVCAKTQHIHAHHDDYSKPLEVRWLCAEHHVAHHRAMQMPI